MFPYGTGVTIPKIFEIGPPVCPEMAFKVFRAPRQPLTVEMDLGALGPLNEIFGSQLDLDLLPQSEESHFWQKKFFFQICL